MKKQPHPRPLPVADPARIDAFEEDSVDGPVLGDIAIDWQSPWTSLWNATCLSVLARGFKATPEAQLPKYSPYLKDTEHLIIRRLEYPKKVYKTFSSGDSMEDIDGDIDPRRGSRQAGRRNTVRPFYA